MAFFLHILSKSVIVDGATLAVGYVGKSPNSFETGLRSYSSVPFGKRLQVVS